MLREAYLARAYLLRSLVQRMEERLGHLNRLIDHARRSTEDAYVHAAIDVLYCAWVLAEQNRRVYEMVANQVDVRFGRKRRGLDARIRNTRDEEQQHSYHYRAWLYPLLEEFPDSEFESLGWTASRAREILREAASI